MDFTEKNERIWGFGFPGNIEFIEGKVIAENSESLNQDHYVTVLIQFTEEIFQTDDHLYQTFEEVKEKALVGSDYGENTGWSESSGSLISTFIPIIIAFMFMMGLVVIVGIAVLFFMRPEVFNVTNQAPGFFRRKYREEYYRDFPYEDNYLDIYFIVYSMGLGSFNTLFTTFLLKWLKEGRIEIETEQEKTLFKKSKPKIIIINNNMEADTHEGKLFEMIKSVAFSDGVLRNDAFVKWASQNRKELLLWEKNVMDQSKSVLEKEKHIEFVEKPFLFTKRKYVLYSRW